MLFSLDVSQANELSLMTNGIQLSHDVLGLAKGEKIYHKNGSRLDCRRENLEKRVGNVFRCDAKHKRKPFKATIWFAGRNFYLGHYPRELWAREAVEAANETARRLNAQKLSKKEIQRAFDVAVGREA